MIKLFIVDDHEIIRKAVRQILSDEEDMEVVGEAADGIEMFSKLSQLTPDIVLMDLNLPGKNGLELIAEMKRKRIKARVLVLTINPEERSAVNSYKAGAAGFVSKNAAIEELVKAIHAIHTKGRYMNPDFAEQLAFDAIMASSRGLDELSSQELKVASMLNDGKDIREIATQIRISIPMALQLRRKIFRKLNINNYIQLVHYFRDMQVKTS